MVSAFRVYYIIIITGLSCQQEHIAFCESPLLGIHFQEPKYIDITVEAGTSYYLKYDEENKMDRSEHTGPFMLMQDNIGRREIAFTELKSSSYNFVAEDASGKIRHKPQELKASQI